MDWKEFSRIKSNYIIVLVCLFLLWLLVVGVAASKVSSAERETESVKEQLAKTQALLAEAREQKVLVIEQKQEEEPKEETPKEEPKVESSPRTVAPATRQDVVPQDAVIVGADESLGMTSLGTFTVSHYCPCHICTSKYPSDPEYGITATGHAAIAYRTVAVDPTVIPYGTVLYLDYGDGSLHEVIADDCGGDIKGHRIDLYAGEHNEALRLGKRTATVYVGGRNDGV